ncbi:hypothetical protein AVEN_129484-1 [Araneus ventricosus]|uniref:Uncharacterized protein n=1 Tax=Araneus ventricosus TaxID=182803 RepID=A0A4Y2S2U4_ARAVE|nr:hypothetical protein AVEN_141018-1 [Araneus ventricosus]GBN82515.1 hypothetical protein AVEN_162611-1 [Araneus ventricosus]GBN82552.1 hypothetical protein AVEN_184872-1 [Araneus ventricosus]GBN82563.1 hypothetical protein AVEN_129484-1 [Araneus ventricosus]
MPIYQAASRKMSPQRCKRRLAMLGQRCFAAWVLCWVVGLSMAIKLDKLSVQIFIGLLREEAASIAILIARISAWKTELLRSSLPCHEAIIP